MQPSNLLKIESLNGDWRDKDSILLHACFQILKDFVEKEDLVLGNTDWNADERNRLAKTEIDELYKWWISYTESDIPEEDNFELENSMLIRLIKIRWALWT